MEKIETDNRNVHTDSSWEISFSCSTKQKAEFVSETGDKFRQRKRLKQKRFLKNKLLKWKQEKLVIQKNWFIRKRKWTTLTSSKKVINTRYGQVSGWGCHAIWRTQGPLKTIRLLNWWDSWYIWSGRFLMKKIQTRY